VEVARAAVLLHQVQKPLVQKPPTQQLLMRQPLMLM